MRSTYAVLKTALACSAAAILPMAPALADGLVHNIRGYTLDEDGKMQQFQGLLIAKDGTVARLMDADDKPPKELDFKLDGKGLTLVPGLIEPSVRLMENALSVFKRDAQMLGRPIQPRERDVAFADAQDYYLANGITTVVDIATDHVGWNVYRRAGDAGRLRMRVLSFASDVDVMTAVAGNQPTSWLYDDRLRMQGLTITNTAPFNDARIRNLLSRGAMDGFQLSVIAQTPDAATHSEAAILEVAETYKGDRRWRIDAPADATSAATERDAILWITPRERSLATLASDFGQRTLGAARAASADKEIGRLAKGMQADFILLTADPFQAASAEAAAGNAAPPQVSEVWISGKRVWPVRR